MPVLSLSSPETFKIQLPTEASSENAVPEEDEGNKESVAGSYGTEEVINSVQNESGIQVVDILPDYSDTAEEQDKLATDADFSRKEDPTYEDYNERPLEHTEYSSRPYKDYECSHRYPIPEFPPGIRITSLDILKLFPAKGRPNTVFPYKCPSCCRAFSSGKSLASHVLQGIGGDFTCRVFYQKGKLMKRRARMEEMKCFMARCRAQSRRERGSSCRINQHEGDCERARQVKRSFSEAIVQAYVESSSSSGESKPKEEDNQPPPAKRQFLETLAPGCGESSRSSSYISSSSIISSSISNRVSNSSYVSSSSINSSSVDSSSSSVDSSSSSSSSRKRKQDEDDNYLPPPAKRKLSDSMFFKDGIKADPK